MLSLLVKESRIVLARARNITSMCAMEDYRKQKIPGQQKQ
jgi:hypothetical protein